MENETESIVKRLKEKRESKEAKLNKKIKDLIQLSQQQQAQNENFQQDIDTLRSSSDKSEAINQIYTEN